MCTLINMDESSFVWNTDQSKKIERISIKQYRFVKHKFTSLQQIRKTITNKNISTSSIGKIFKTDKGYKNLEAMKKGRKSWNDRELQKKSSNRIQSSSWVFSNESLKLRLLLHLPSWFGFEFFFCQINELNLIQTNGTTILKV